MPYITTRIIHSTQIIVHYALYKLMYIHSPGHAVSQLVEALRYKPEGRGFDSRWCHWNFSIDIILPGRTMALGLTQPLTEMSTSNVFWG